MLVVIEWSTDAFGHEPSRRTLVEAAAEHEIVLVHPCAAVGLGTVLSLRAMLPRHDLVSLVVAGEVARHERRLVEELLEDGAIPVLLAPEGCVAAALTGWLNADTTIALPESRPAAPLPREELRSVS
jgi:acetylglutamate kinase